MLAAAILTKEDFSFSARSITKKKAGFNSSLYSRQNLFSNRKKYDKITEVVT